METAAEAQARRFLRACSIFDALCDRSASSWPAEIAARCGGDRRLADQVAGMLAHDRASRVGLDGPPTLAPNRVDAAIRIAAPLGPFMLQQPLGVGGMGEVWRGVHVRTQAPVAIKLMLSNMAPVEAMVAAFSDEVRAVAGLSHANIVRIFDYGRLPAQTVRVADEAGVSLVAGVPYLVMELASGGSLAGWCRAPMPWAPQQEALLSLLSALGCAHAHGLIHRDIKPSNILLATPLDLRPGLKLADFGVACLMDNAASRGIAGTIGYMAPEQRAGDGRRMGPAADLYAVGVLAYVLLHGALPASRDWCWAPRVPTPPHIEGWVRCLLSPSPEDRFPSAAAAQQALGMTRPSAPPVHMPELPQPALADIGLGLIGLRAPQMVGREEEQAQLWSIAMTPEGGRVVILQGAEGVGKRRLAQWLSVSARQADRATVYTAVNSAAPGAMSLVTLLRQATRCQDLEGTALTDHFLQLGASPSECAALEAVLGVREGIPAALQRAALLQMLVRLARSACVCIFEDAARSPLLLRLVQDGLRAALPICFILTVRAETVVSAGKRWVSLRTHPRATVMELQPLPPPLWGALIDGFLPFEPGLHALLAQQSAGNPGAAVALIRQCAQQKILEPSSAGFRLRSGARVPSISAESDVFWRKQLADVLEMASTDAQIALERSAVLGSHINATEWAAICGDDGRALLEEMFRIGLVHAQPDGWAFAHRSLRDALLQRADAAGRLVVHHNRCVDVLRTQGADAERIGRHLVQAGRSAEALAPLFDAVLQLRRCGQYRQSSSVAVLWGQAADDAETASSADRLRMLAAQVSNATLLNDLTTAARLLEPAHALASGNPDGFAELLIHESYVHRIRGDEERGFRVTQRAFEQGQSSDDPLIASRVRIFYAARLSTRGQLDQARIHLQDAIDRLEALPALSDTAGRFLTDAYRRVAFIDLTVGNTEGAQHALDHARQAVDRRHDLFWQRSCDILQTAICIERREMARAGMLANTSMELGRRLGVETMQIESQLLIAHVDILQGHFQEGWDALSRVLVTLDPRKRQQATEVHILRLPAAAALGAWDAWEEGVARVHDTGLSYLQWAQALSWAGEQAVRVGRPERAATVWDIAAAMFHQLGRPAQAQQLEERCAALAGVIQGS